MNISGFISDLKQKARDRETRRAVKVANELKDLKAERVRAEGQKKIYALKASEISKAQKAKAELRQLKRESTFLGRVGLQVEKNLKDNKKKGSKDKKVNLGFGSDSPNAWFPK